MISWAETAISIARWALPVLLLVIFVDQIRLNIGRRRLRRDRLRTSESLFDVALCSRSNFTLERLRVILDGRLTETGKVIRTSPYSLGKTFDATIVDLDHPTEVPPSHNLIGVYDRTPPSDTLGISEIVPLRPSELSRIIRIRDEKVSQSLVVLFVYGLLTLMALGFVGVLVFGFLRDR